MFPTELLVVGGGEIEVVPCDWSIVVNGGCGDVVIVVMLAGVFVLNLTRELGAVVICASSAISSSLAFGRMRVCCVSHFANKRWQFILYLKP